MRSIVKTRTVSILVMTIASAWGAGDAATPAILWKDPANARRDLFYGPGGKADQPRGPFTFEKEDLDGTNPKFVVRDADGVKWKVKLGLEARPETVATRLVWAVGYFATEDYFLRDMKIAKMPVKLHRGQKLVEPGGVVHNVRLKREPKDRKKLGNWSWDQDVFTGSRQWNGLRVMMAVMNNWDLKDVNNAIYRVDSERIFLVSDLGATFGTAGRSWPRERSKDNLDMYSLSKFIRRTTPQTVDFETPARPKWVFLVNPKEYLSRVHLEHLGKNVPRADARWIGELLARLSPDQIHDAFRAGGYSPEEIAAFSRIVQARITALTDL